jgi:hypothetical protein
MITQECLKALAEGKVVEYNFVSGADKWMGLQYSNGRLELLAMKKLFEISPVEYQRYANLDYVALAMITKQWRLPVEQRDWMGALEWLKRRERVRRPSWKEGVSLKHYDRGDIELVMEGQPCGCNLCMDDFTSTDWVLADE